MIKDHEAKIQAIKNQNVKLKEQGRPLLKVPTMQDLEDDIEFMEVETKIEKREIIFNDIQEDERFRIFQLGEYNPKDGIYRGPVPIAVNPLNIAVVNTGL